MLCQFALSLLGLGGDHDLGMDVAHDVGGMDHADIHGGGDDAHHGSTGFFKVLSFRSVVAALTFFGLGGMAAATSEHFASMSLPIGLVSGVLAMVVVAWLMRLLHTLNEEGNVHIEGAVGSLATVYLTIPPHDEGAGKVTVSFQGRTMEFQAVSNEPEPLKTGSPVVVLSIVGPGIVEVGPVPE